MEWPTGNETLRGLERQSFEYDLVHAVERDVRVTSMWLTRGCLDGIRLGQYKVCVEQREQEKNSFFRKALNGGV